MPPIDTVRCSECDYGQKVPASGMALVWDATTRIYLPHPSEWRTAQRLTLMNFSELADEGRIVFMIPYLCLGCGAIHDREPGGTRELRVVSPYRFDDPNMPTEFELSLREMDPKWEDGYKHFEVGLNKAIEQSRSLASPDYPCGTCGSESVYRVRQLLAYLADNLDDTEGMPEKPIPCPKCKSGELQVFWSGAIS